MKKRIDNYYRITIPSEYRNNLGLTKGDEIEIYEEDNKIILSKIKNDPDLSVDETKLEKNKSYLQEKIEEMPYGNNYWKDDVKNISDECSNQKCGICSNMVEVSRLNKLKINGKPICESCFIKFKDEIIREVQYNKRIKDIQSKLNI